MSIPIMLISKGYTPYRRKFINGESKDVVCEFDNNYSTMGNGELFYIFKKEGQKDIFWGLNEKGKPPTLIHPRPNMDLDDNINRIINKLTSEELYDMIK